MSHYFLCSQNNDSKNIPFFQMLSAKQNQKFPFHFFFRFAVEGWGEETREKCKEIFWFLHTRVRERVRGALVRITTQSERMRQFQATTRSARAISRSRDLIQNTFELCLANTAIKRNWFFGPEGGPPEGGDTNAFPPPNGESKRVFHAPRGSSFANTIL